MNSQTPQNGHVQWLSHELGWLRLPLPLGIDHINVWLLAEDDGFTLVDAGLYTPNTIQIWEQLLRTELSAKPLKRIILTHRHADHTGMAGWLAERTGALLWMSLGEYQAAYLGQNQQDHTDAVNFYHRAGWPDELCRSLPDYYQRAQSWVSPLPPLDRILTAGDIIQMGPHHWQILIGQGHCDEHICLYCPEKNWLIGGDQVLPDVSANISVLPQAPLADPLGQWFASMEQFFKLSAQTLVLPAHGEPYQALHALIQKQVFARQKAVKRLQMLPSLSLPVTLFPSLYKSPVNLKSHSAMLMATGEAVAYINYLTRRIKDL